MSKKKAFTISNEWLTHFEKSDGLSTPDYNETMEYFSQFSTETPYVKIDCFGRTPQGRDLNLLVVSKDGISEPEQAHESGKAIVLIQNCIHAGEPEGKDACMLLLRDMLVTGKLMNLLNNIVLLIIPVFNIDGHERLSPYNRPNQNGPKQTGWRTNALNLNLNRDYLKADSPEMKAWLKMFTYWMPDFMIDNHTTNGADYQYHITYGIEKHRNISSVLSGWVRKKFLPFVISEVEKEGFITGPYVEMRGRSLGDGIIDWPAPPRVSNGYCATRNRVCLLVETHSLKPFANRVASTLSMNKAVLKYINRHSAELIKLNRRAERDSVSKYYSRKEPFPVIVSGSERYEEFQFKGIESYLEYSEITGSEVVRYTGVPVEFNIPFYNKSRVVKTTILPDAYLIPAEFSELVSITKLHGIEHSILTKEMMLKVEKYVFTNFSFAGAPYEGRLMLKASYKTVEEEMSIPEGTFIIKMGQPSLRVIANLFEPDAPDSFISWGFFNAFFERKEYAEAYVMEPQAIKMIQRNFALRQEFFSLLESDEGFRNDPSRRLDFFYTRSEFFDKREKVYPVFRLMKLNPGIMI